MRAHGSSNSAAVPARHTMPGASLERNKGKETRLELAASCFGLFWEGTFFRETTTKPSLKGPHTV